MYALLDQSNRIRYSLTRSLALVLMHANVGFSFPTAFLLIFYYITLAKHIASGFITHHFVFQIRGGFVFFDSFFSPFVSLERVYPLTPL